MPVFTYDPGTKESTIIEALRTVVDPELGLNLVELGLIQGVEVTPDQINVKMILTTPFCPYGPAMLDQVRQKAKQATGQPTLIELGTDLWDPSMMEEGAGGDWGLF